MIELLVGMLVGAVGAWFLVRHKATPSPYTPSAPTPRGRDEESRITLPVADIAEPEGGGSAGPGDAVPTTGADAGMAARGGATAYCVRCKVQRPMTKVENYTTTNGRSALKGTCPVCGAGLFKFVKE